MSLSADEKSIEFHHDSVNDLETDNSKYGDFVAIIDMFETHHIDTVVQMIRVLVTRKQAESLILKYPHAQNFKLTSYNEFISKLRSLSQGVVIDLHSDHHEAVVSILSGANNIENSLEVVFDSSIFTDWSLTFLVSDCSARRISLIHSTERLRTLNWHSTPHDEIALPLDQLDNHCLFRPRNAVPLRRQIIESKQFSNPVEKHILQEVTVNKKPLFRNSCYMLSFKQKQVLIGREGGTIARVRKQLSATTTIIIGGSGNYDLEIWGIPEQIKRALELINQIMRVHGLSRPIRAERRRV